MTEKSNSYWTRRCKICARVSRHLSEMNTVQAASFQDSAASSSFTSSAFPEVEMASTSRTCPQSVDTYPVVSASGKKDSQFQANSYEDPALSFDESQDTDDMVSSDDEQGAEYSDIPENLADWATKYKISLSALSALLGILQPVLPCLPKDARTLLGTLTVANFTSCAGGQYYHFGILNNLMQKLRVYPSILSKPGTMLMQINIDGLPLFKSSRGEFWPILGMLDQIDAKDPFIIGLFYGNSKPCSLSEYLRVFVDECSHLQKEGFTFEGIKFGFQLSAVICDAPARAFVKNIKSHSGYYGCDKCKQRGEYHSKVTFPETGVELRQDSDFVVAVDDDDDDVARTSFEGSEKSLQKRSPLAELELGMVSQFPVDYMHLCCLGVTRRILRILTKGPLKFRLGPRVISSISDHLIAMRSFVPREFARKPRSLCDLDRWKATELRFFMLYASPIVLRKHVPAAIYENFMLFVVGMHILLSPRFCDSHVDYAEHILTTFVQHYAKLYGRDQVVYNVHTVSHLANDARKYGPLDNVSAFPFESYLGQLKKLVRRPTLPLQQVVRRLSEQPQKPKCGKAGNHPAIQHYDGPVPEIFFGAQQFREVNTKDFLISVDQGNNCVEVGGEVVSVRNILLHCDKLHIVFERFLCIQSLFQYPCDSTTLGIFSVSGRRTGLETCPLSVVTNKFVVLPCQQQGCMGAIPLLHPKNS